MSQADVVKEDNTPLTNVLRTLFNNNFEAKKQYNEKHEVFESPNARRKRIRTQDKCKPNATQNIKDFLDKSYAQKTKNDDDTVEILSDDDDEENGSADDEDDVEREFKKLKKTQASQKENRCKPNTEFKCIHCSKFICDLEITDVQQVSLDSMKRQIPKSVTEIMNLINCKSFHRIDKNSLSTTGLSSNSDVKFAFNQNTSRLNENILFNAYIDDKDESCWQFSECRFCLNLIGFTLKFTNEKELSQILNKYFLIIL
jgi:hypothetical protein